MCECCAQKVSVRLQTHLRNHKRGAGRMNVVSACESFSSLTRKKRVSSSCAEAGENTHQTHTLTRTT